MKEQVRTQMSEVGKAVRAPSWQACTVNHWLFIIVTIIQSGSKSSVYQMQSFSPILGGPTQAFYN